MQTIHLGQCLTKFAEISLDTLLKSCIEILDETEQIKNQFKAEYPNLL